MFKRFQSSVDRRPLLIRPALVGIGLGWIELVAIGDHYLVGRAVSRGELVVGIIVLFVCGTVIATTVATWLLSLSTSALIKMLRMIVRRPARWFDPTSWTPKAALILVASASVWIQVVIDQSMRSGPGFLRAAPVLHLAATVGFAIASSSVLYFLADRIAAAIAGRKWLPQLTVQRRRLGLLGFVLLGFGTALMAQSRDAARLLLFDKTLQTGIVFRAAYRATDFDSDGFAPWWIGGDDRQWLDSEHHPLSAGNGVRSPVSNSPGSFHQTAASPTKPRLPSSGANLILITVDTLSARRLGMYGNQRRVSPALDRLAESGVRVEDCIAQWSATSPSMATILTGTYPGTHGVVAGMQPIRPNRTLIAEVLADAGYRTGGFVHNPNLSAALHFDQGFEHYALLSQEQSDVEVTSEALRWLAKVASPFFLWVHYIDPHSPYRPRPPELGRFSHGEQVPVRRRSIHPAARTSSGDLRTYIDRYEEEIVGVDKEIGRLLERLQTLGKEVSDALIVFTSDHGESFSHGYFADHGRFSYDDLVRVPLVIQGPGLARGRHLETQVQSVDVFPTILDLLGVELPNHVEGKSFAAMLGASSKPPLPDEPLAFTQSGFLGLLDSRRFRTAVRTPNWKYIWTPSFNIHELYDLQNDPRELDNVHQHRPEVAGRLRSHLASWLSRQGMHHHDSSPAVDESLLDDLRALGYVD